MTFVSKASYKGVEKYRQDAHMCVVGRYTNMRGDTGVEVPKQLTDTHKVKRSE